MATYLLDMSDLARLTNSELESELTTLAAHLNAGTSRWLELIGELDRRGSWAKEGHDSLAPWIAWRCALMPRTAREYVRVARRLPGLPVTRAAFARGELSYAKVRALTRVAMPENEEELLGFARSHSAAQLERCLRAYRRLTVEEARRQQEDAQLAVFWNDDGMLELHGRLAPEDGALVLRALDAVRDSLWQQAPGSAEPRPARQASYAEALVAVADAALAHDGESRPGGERYQVVVHVDEPALADDGEGGCELDDGSGLAPETARRLACDASVVRAGRKTRAIPPSTRRALSRRDRGCRFPGCENRRFVDAHHVHHWSKGGETSLANLVQLCRRHHRAVHEGGYRVDAEGRFFYPWGGEIAAVPPLPHGDPAELLERNSDLGIHEDTCQGGPICYAGEFSLAYSVDALFEIEHRIARRARAPAA